ncbi:MAG: hypothetical protein PVI43_07295, partial [Candidatus Bathyarchaeota archaeon]
MVLIRCTALTLTVILAFLILGPIVLASSSETASEEPQLEWNKNYGHVSGMSILQVNSEELVIAADAGTDYCYWAHGEYDYKDRGGALFKIDLNGDIIWRTELPVSPVALIETRDGGFAIAGWTRRGIGVKDNVGLVEMRGYFISLVKTDSQGKVLWHQAYENQTELTRYGTQQNRLSVKSVLQTSDGGFVLGGSKQGHDNNANHYYYYEAWLMKTDADGNRLWMNYYGTERYDKEYSYRYYENDTINIVDRIVETAPDGFLFTGYIDGAIIVKTDSMGNIQWTKT